MLMVIKEKIFRGKNTHFGSIDPILTILHSFEFRNSIHIRDPKIAILQFDILKRGHSDILELDIPVF